MSAQTARSVVTSVDRRMRRLARAVEQRQRPLDLTGAPRRIRGCQQSPTPGSVVGAQRRGSLERRGGDAVRAPSLSVLGEPLEIRADRGIDAHSGGGLIHTRRDSSGSRRQDVGEREVRAPPRARGRRPMDGRPDQGMPEPDGAAVDDDEIFGLEQVEVPEVELHELRRASDRRQ